MNPIGTLQLEKLLYAYVLHLVEKLILKLRQFIIRANNYGASNKSTELFLGFLTPYRNSFPTLNWLSLIYFTLLISHLAYFILVDNWHINYCYRLRRSSHYHRGNGSTFQHLLSAITNIRNLPLPLVAFHSTGLCCYAISNSVRRSDTHMRPIKWSID